MVAKPAREGAKQTESCACGACCGGCGGVGRACWTWRVVGVVPAEQAPWPAAPCTLGKRASAQGRLAFPRRRPDWSAVNNNIAR